MPLPLLKVNFAADAGAGFTSGDGSDRAWSGRGVKVPALSDVLAWLPADLGLVIEIKVPAAVDAVVDAVRDHAVQADGRLSVIAFDERSIERVRELAPEVTTGYLLVPGQPLEPALEWAVEHGHAGVHAWEGDLGVDPARLVALATAYGRRLGCYVINDPERMQQLAALGLWGFVTDVPDVARAALPRSVGR
jgi:glycerophosphoryl diester phosphodiesterase